MKKQSYKSYKFRQKSIPYLFLAPNLIIFATFIIFPAFIGIYYSFTDMTLFTFGTPNFIGLENYATLLQDEEFIAALKNIIFLVMATVPLIFVSSLAIAILIIQPIKGKSFWRAIYYWPVMISPIVVGIIWQWILAGDFGLFNTILKNLGLNPMETLINPRFAWWAVVFAKVWSRTGYFMIIFMAALLSIPQSLYEAAKVDGANRMQRFWHVTYPAHKPARLMVFILLTMEIFKIYPMVVTLTGGGPFDHTQFTVQYIYETAFKSYQIGYSSAMSVIMLLFVTIFTALNFMLQRGGKS
jgi:alpha-1,4-digalacturonate transport system permease protein